MHAPTKRIRLTSKHQRALPRTVVRGQAKSAYEDLYHFILGRSWLRFFLTVALVFAFLNTLFALLYVIDPGGLTNVRPHSFEDAFFFSVQTIATIGYGNMAPADRYTHVVVTIEALTGMLSTALVTGITFAKFARPTSRVLFANNAVITTRDGVPHLMFRMANWRQNMVLEAQLRVVVLVTETTREGETLRRQIELPLVRERTAIFALTFLAMHKIDESSPFYGDGKSAKARLAAMRAEVFLSLSGIDETVGQTIHARHYYELDDIVWNARFADVLSIAADGARTLDYTRFHEVIPTARHANDEPRAPRRSSTPKRAPKRPKTPRA
jgi:inward rectifier potassium channel